MAIDIIDEKLLEVLQVNARISISDLSKKINLSLSAVSERLKKLEASGVITQYTAILDPEEMDKHVEAVMYVSVDNTHNAEFEKFVNGEGDILLCSRVTGEYDYILRIFTKDTMTLEAIIDKTKSLRCVKGVNTAILLSHVKVKHSVPPVATK